MAVELWFIYSTHLLTEGNICAKLFQNPPFHVKVTAQTRISYVNNSCLQRMTHAPDGALNE